MAGHSKWSNIQHRKQAQDAKRGRLFTKLIREITVAARNGADPALHPRLRLAIDKALVANVSREAIDRAIKRGVGGLEGHDLEEIRYEGYGPGGVAIMVDALTNNRNRTAAEVRHAFSKYGGNLGTDGAVAWQFHQKGLISLQDDLDEEQLMALALATGAEDILNASEANPAYLITAVNHFNSVCLVLEQHEVTLHQAEITWLPTTLTPLEDDSLRDTVHRLLEALEALEDIQTVYAACVIGAF